MIKTSLPQDEDNFAKKLKTSTATVTSGILEFIKRESLHEIIGKCAALDGFSFHAIYKSEAIRGFVNSQNYAMPKSVPSIRKNVLVCFEEKKAETMQKILKHLTSKEKFSITVDEWTDVLMRRYLNVTVHTVSDHFVLGLVFIDGSCTSKRMEELVHNRLSDYGINLDHDIVASTHDGANVMVRYGLDLKAVGQMCYNHAIHLAVVKVLYNCETEIQEPELIEEDDYSESDEDDPNIDEDPGFEPGMFTFSMF